MIINYVSDLKEADLKEEPRGPHKWHLNLNNNTDTSLASNSCENSSVLKHECEAKDVPSIVIQAPFMQNG